MIWWNIWVLLAMPAIWLAWAMTAFCVAIMSYVWRTGSAADPPDGMRPQLDPGPALALRVVLTAVFVIGLVYFVLILRTFGRYGEREAGWRRSWLATSHPRAGRARERNRADDERERGRRREREQGRGDVDERPVPSRQNSDPDEKVQSPVMGLGLLGVSGSTTNGLVSTSSVQPKESDTENSEKKGEMYRMGRVSPKL